MDQALIHSQFYISLLFYLYFYGFHTATNMTLWAETDSAQDFKIRTALHYTWPRIGGSKVIVFPLTAIGNESLVEISIQNPTSSPLFVQALLGSDYGPNWAQHVQGNGVGGNVTEGNMGKPKLIGLIISV